VSVTLGGYTYATKKNNACNGLINRLFQLIVDISTCILYFLPDTYQNIRNAKAAEGTPPCLYINTLAERGLMLHTAETSPSH